jgi:hypothetical protein
MSFDLAIAANGDLILSAARDFQGATGKAIIEQRIQLRLKLTKGSWIFDPAQRLGSNVQEIFGLEPEMAAVRVIPLVKEALRPMDEEIEINDVTARPDGNAVIVTVYYRMIFLDESGVAEFSEGQTLGISIPLAD